MRRHGFDLCSRGGEGTGLCLVVGEGMLWELGCVSFAAEVGRERRKGGKGTDSGSIGLEGGYHFVWMLMGREVVEGFCSDSEAQYLCEISFGRCSNVIEAGEKS